MGANPVTTWCTWCDESFAPVEYVTVPQDPDEPRFCSTGCEEALSAAESAYEEARYTGAPTY